jgi:hypothetical protein
MSLRELPDFLKTGDPALTYPRGLEYTPLHPKGRPREPWPEDPQAVRHIAVSEWLAHVAAGRIGAGDTSAALQLARCWVRPIEAHAMVGPQTDIECVHEGSSPPPDDA